MTKNEYFLSILKQCSFYPQFIKNGCEYISEEENTFLRLLLRKDISQWINVAFHWVDTLEGDKFWEEIHAKWYSFANTNNRKILKNYLPEVKLLNIF